MAMITRVLLAAALALAAPAIAAPAKPAAARADWTRTIVATPQGFRIGNPKAAVRLVEYGSFTCSHCRDFHRDANAALRARYIAGGRVSFEFRSFVRNGPDYIATLLAACDGPARYAANTAALLSTQDDWMAPFIAIDPAAGAKLDALPAEQRIAALAKAGGLDRFMAARGLSAAKADRCLADKAAADRLTATLKAAVETEKIEGTPGFLINGVRQIGSGATAGRGITTWADLEPRLVEALR